MRSYKLEIYLRKLDIDATAYVKARDPKAAAEMVLPICKENDEICVQGRSLSPAHKSRRSITQFYVKHRFDNPHNKLIVKKI